MIQFIRNGVVVFDLAWLVNPYTWIGKLSLGIGLPIFAKVFLQSDFYRNLSPFSKRYNQKLRTEIETKLRDNLPDSNPRQKSQEFPALSFETIAHLQKSGFIHFEEGAKISATRFSPERPMSFQITIDSTKNTYQVFNAEHLGGGAFGDAYIGQNIHSGAWVAVKMQRFRDTAKEQDVLIENKHLLADGKLLGQAIYEKNDQKYLLSVMPLFSKDNPIYCNSSEKIDFLIAVAYALEQFHKKNKIHSDLHFGNVCWNKAEGVAHLIDYGSIVDTENISETSSHYVPKLHVPPESLFGFGLLHVKASDVFSLGCMAERLFEKNNDQRLNLLISNMKHKLFFKRPSLVEIIRELINIKNFSSDIAQKSIKASDKKDQQLLNQVHEEVEKYKLILKELDNEIVMLKKIPESEVDYIHLAMLVKEKSIYQDYFQQLNSSVELYHRFDCSIQLDKKKDELHKEIKQLMTLNSDYQPKIPIVTSAKPSFDYLQDDKQRNTLLMQFNPSAQVKPTQVQNFMPTHNDNKVNTRPNL